MDACSDPTVRLFLSLDALRARKDALRDPLAIGGLAASLQRELHEALDVPVPDGKSRLTRNGGRCVRCTVLLTFDPRSPDSHACPSCDAVYTDQVHHEWWLMNGHLWTAEQCTRAAALAYLLDDEKAAQRADDILATYAARYLTWPNRDNALGPTRPFFSTYLESIWLLHLATALDVRIAAKTGVYSQAGEILDRIVAPSAALIAGFDEGRSNRQVWHVAALLAASRLLGDDVMRDRAASSLVTLLDTGLHTDGSWYEGENYHLFAHRGLLSGVTLAEQAGIKLPRTLLQRFEDGFASPFLTMLPDGTFPARRDSQYGVALRQYRTADWVECGFARRDTPELRAALGSLYAEWPEAGETHRWSSSADAERNVPGVRLTRADCSWRALLLARIDLPVLTDATPKSELLEGQGLAVFRRNGGKFWVGLDYGDPGDGHGHPDRLNLVIATEEARWLDDVGTGSYTSPTLNWYRSSMAHNAPMVNGKDQGAARGRLLAYDEQDDAGWISAEFVDPVSGVRFVRTVVVMEDYVIDEVEWTSTSPVFVDVPLQFRDFDAHPHRWVPFVPGTEQDAMLADAACASAADGTMYFAMAHALPRPGRVSKVPESPDFACTIWCAQASTVWRATTIGPPAGPAHGLLSLRQRGTGGLSRRIIGSIDLTTFALTYPDEIVIRSPDDETHRRVHRRVETGWRIETHSGASVSAIVLRSQRDELAQAIRHDISLRDTPKTQRCPNDGGCSFQLGEREYRNSEDSWHAAGAPSAGVGVRVANREGAALIVTASVTLGRPPQFAAARLENPLDNELSDVNSDGVQLHWRSANTGVWNSVIAVPDGASVRMTVESGALDGLTATWAPTDKGFHLAFELPWPESWPEFVFDLCVNEMPAGRERRRGQLVLSGARGESAYLRGARQPETHAFHVAFDPAPDPS